MLFIIDLMIPHNGMNSINEEYKFMHEMYLPIA